MTSPTTDRRFNLVGNMAVKAPVAATADGNIVQSGEQTIDGIAVHAINAAGAPDRVLCTGMTNPALNGIWDVSTAAWTRSLDADGPFDLQEGSLVGVNAGTTYGLTYWRLDTPGNIVVGVTAQDWDQVLGGSLGPPTPAVGGVNLPDFTMYPVAQGGPVSRRWEFPNTNPNTWNLSGGTMTFDAEFTINSYWAANPNAHFGIGLRCDMATISTQPRFHGTIFGHLSNIQDGAPWEPASQIETRATGLDPGGTLRFLVPYSWSPATRPIQDGVTYKIFITSKKTINATNHIAYKLWQLNVAHSAGSDKVWDLIVDTGDMLDPNTFLDMTKYGLVFFSVFEDNLVPWSIAWSKVNVTWSDVDVANPDNSARANRMDKVKVGIIGDSMSATNSLIEPAWPDVMALRLGSLNAPIELHNLAKDGWTFNKANTVAQFGTWTMIQQAISLDLDVVIVALGANDAVLNIEGRNLAQCEADAATAFAALRAGLPHAVIIYGSQLMYDSANFATPSVTLKNKAVPVYLWQRKTAGILNGMVTSEVLDDSVAAATKANYGQWVSLDAYIKVLATVDGNFTLPHWKAARLGLVGVDNIHLTAMGHLFVSAAAVIAFQGSVKLAPLFQHIGSQSYWPWNDPDQVFSTVLTPAADGYVDAAYDSQVTTFSKHASLWQRLNPDVWYFPSKAVVKVFPTAFTADSLSTPYWSVMNARPNTAVEVSLGGGAFSSAGQSTDAYGCAIYPYIAGQLPAAVYTARYRVGDEVFGPFVTTVTAPGEPYLSVHQTGDQLTAGADTFNRASLGTTEEVTGITWAAPTATIIRPGRYSVQGQITIAGVPDMGAVVAMFYKNGARFKDGNTSYMRAGGTGFVSAVVGGSYRLAAGDTIELYCFQLGGGGALNISKGGGQSTWLTISWEGF